MALRKVNVGTVTTLDRDKPPGELFKALVESKVSRSQNMCATVAIGMCMKDFSRHFVVIWNTLIGDPLVVFPSVV